MFKAFKIFTFFSAALPLVVIFSAICGYFASNLLFGDEQTPVIIADLKEKKKSSITAQKNVEFALTTFNSTVGYDEPNDYGTTPAEYYPTIPIIKSYNKTPYASSRTSFTFKEIGDGQGPTILIIGGIQGDEPGGFSAASLITTYYSVNSGSIWVIPDLNFASILKRNRGLFGDMNRKFAHLDEKDPEYEIIERLKKVILHDRVDLILNLHDGSGFYRPTHIDKLRNPKRWGQSVIIDQEKMSVSFFGELLEMAQKASDDANKSLLNQEHRYYVHNTRTKEGDREMEKSLSYFAVLNDKPAFGVEASKELGTEIRCYYHLNIIESFMRQMGIEFERHFDLSPDGILTAMNSDLMLTAFGDRLLLPLNNARPSITNVPFNADSHPEAKSSKPLLALVNEKSEWRVAYGNRTLTKIHPAYMPFDESLEYVSISIDGNDFMVGMGEMITVAESFIVKDLDGFRVNAIGAKKEINGTEAGVLLKKNDFIQKYSVDKDANIFRVEFYRDKAFAGMILVNFGEYQQLADEALTATNGVESNLGF